MRLAMAVLMSLVLVCTGCGKGPDLPDPVAVTGKITLDKKPADTVTVVFTAISGGLPDEFRHARVNTNAQGEYSIPEVYPAEYQVQIFKIDSSTPTDPATDVANPFAESPFAPYGTESPLRAVVKKDATRFDFDLSHKKIK